MHQPKLGDAANQSTAENASSRFDNAPVAPWTRAEACPNEIRVQMKWCHKWTER